MRSAAGQNGTVLYQAELAAPVPVATLYPWVADLGRYPQWLDLVAEADPEADAADAADAVDVAWAVTLTARLGPLRRSKRLRMVRTVAVEPSRVVFERREADGREHSMWRLSASLEDQGATSRLTMGLFYGGTLWASPLEGLLRNQVETGRDRLVALVTGP